MRSDTDSNDSSSNGSHKAKTQKLFKTEMCRSWLSNANCRYGDRCQFAHGELDIRPVLSRHPKYKTELCKNFYSNGFCPYGPRCHFVHNSGENETTKNGMRAGCILGNGKMMNGGDGGGLVGGDGVGGGGVGGGGGGGAISKDILGDYRDINHLNNSNKTASITNKFYKNGFTGSKTISPTLASAITTHTQPNSLFQSNN